MASQSIGRRIGFPLAALGLGLVAVAVLAEGLVRALRPVPRVQVVRLSQIVYLGEVEGTPIWRSTSVEELYDDRCTTARPEAARVAAFGTSILQGSGLAPAEVWSTLLQDRLADAGAPCVLNFATAGSHFETGLATARVELPRVKPDLVVFEIWGGSLGHFERVGDSLYEVGALVVDETGMPNRFGLPPSLSLGLYRVSSLYEYAALTAAERRFDPGGVAARYHRLAREELPALEALTRESGADLVLVVTAPMDLPFAEQRALRERDDGRFGGQRVVFDWARERGVPVVDVAAIFEDQRPEDVSIDPCCHLNPAGMEQLAAHLEPVVRGLLTD